MHKLAQNVLSASGGKRSPSDRDSENDETPELKKTKSEDTATATNTESPDVAESVMETVSSEAAAAAPKFKYLVKAKNLPHGQVKEMKNFFTNLGFSKFSKAPNQTFAFLSFPTEEEALAAQKVVEGMMYRNKHKIETSISKEKERVMQPRPAKDVNDTRTPTEKLLDQVTPLHKLSYEEQLKKKHDVNVGYMSSIKRKLKNLKGLSREGRDEISWVYEKTPQQLPCELMEPIASPEINGYRTKCEFSVGTNLNDERSVGFLLGMYKDGQTRVQSPAELSNIPDIAKKIANGMEQYIRQSEYPPYDRVSHEGVWRSLLVRSPKTGEVMVMVQLQEKDMTPEQLESEKKKIVEYWADFEKSENIPIKTLLIQTWSGSFNGIVNDDKATTDIMTGDGFVHEEILGCRFRISYNSFFQINTPATELLYKTCADWCNIDESKKSVLLDLCCGTGTIGITMAKSVNKVIGVDIVPEAIVDARANAERNGITNVEYYASKVEDKLDVFNARDDEELVAILDPPRAGVHKSVISAVRKSKLKRLIYVSCDAKLAQDNFLALCRPSSNAYPGNPFKPSRAVSVDLFPHTDSCELIIEFSRE
ncbi:hypothetical protein INT44_003084 [Umbelopsis vinacea]|uniref:Uncharacterized protein n=1 Tax=Umbelopsis vinacea TaxID=44442 RepID=A0A8H7Q6G8_9FUNG|nr:hypothetical protein INT44_003084 [Umbelopsis vinacea]KAI9288093.1 S-adenosyl-L-methionine-dependent methyltransferase [Umbelopsis sp. AD052]